MEFCFEGVIFMAYETKVILSMLADRVVVAKSKKEIYSFIRKAAAVEGVSLPEYEKAVEEHQNMLKESEE